MAFLNLSRRPGQEVIILLPDGREIPIRARPKPGHRGQTDLAIDAPADVKVYRRELLERIRAGKAGNEV